MPKFNHCESCGMPLMTDSDYGGQDKNNTWCKYCCNNDGTHRTYDEVLSRMSKFMFSQDGQQMSGIEFKSLEKARVAAKEYMAKMPAWKDN